MLWYSGQRIVGIKITETVMETESETGTERESEDRKKKNESEGRMKNGGKGNVMMENAPTKRETRRGRRTRSVFGRKERMKTLESPLLMLTLKSHQGTTKKKTVPEKTAWETRYTTCHTFKIITFFFFYVFESSILWSPGLHLFDQIYNEKSNIVKYYYNLNIFLILIYFKMLFLWWQSWIFSSLQCHMILQKSF